MTFWRISGTMSLVARSCWRSGMKEVTREVTKVGCRHLNMLGLFCCWLSPSVSTLDFVFYGNYALTNFIALQYQKWVSVVYISSKVYPVVVDCECVLPSLPTQWIVVLSNHGSPWASCKTETPSSELVNVSLALRKEDLMIKVVLSDAVSTDIVLYMRHVSLARRSLGEV